MEVVMSRKSVFFAALFSLSVLTLFLWPPGITAPPGGVALANEDGNDRLGSLLRTKRAKKTWRKRTLRKKTWRKRRVARPHRKVIKKRRGRGVSKTGDTKNPDKNPGNRGNDKPVKEQPGHVKAVEPHPVEKQWLDALERSAEGFYKEYEDNNNLEKLILAMARFPMVRDYVRDHVSKISAAGSASRIDNLLLARMKAMARVNSGDAKARAQLEKIDESLAAMAEFHPFVNKAPFLMKWVNANRKGDALRRERAAR